MAAKLKIREEYIFIAIIVILSVLVFPFLFKMGWPNFKQYMALTEEVNRREDELKSRKETVAQIEELKRKVSQIEEEYRNFIQKVSLKPGSVEAVKVITDTAEGIKIEFQSIQPSRLEKITLISEKEATKETSFFGFFQKESKDDKGQVAIGMPTFIWEIPLTIRIRADYANILALMERIENSARFMRVKRFFIRKNNSTPFLHDAELIISLFSLPEE